MSDETKGVATAKAPAPSSAAYNAFVASADVRDIRLIKSEFSVSPEALEERHALRREHACDITQSHYDSDNKLLYAWVAASAACYWKRKRILSSKCQYLIVYTVNAEPDDAAVPVFIRRVARFAAYPYFRSHFAHLASQAGLEIPPLPVIKERRFFPPSLKQDESKKEGEVVGTGDA